MTELEALHQDKRNARKHSPRNLGMIEKSLGEVGAARSIVIDEQDNILAGNGTHEVATRLGMKLQVVESDGETIIAVRRRNLTPEQKQRLALFDNRSSETAEWDVDVLGAILAENHDALEGMFTKDELAELIDDLLQAPGDGGDDFDTTPDDGPTRVQRGELWQLGEHRLLCGDSTNADDVARLMDGERAAICFTSPPYAAQRTYTIGTFDWDALMDGVFLNLFDYLLPDASILVNLGLVHNDGKVNRYWDGWLARMEQSGNPLYGWYVWDQGWGLPGDWAGRLAPSCEFIFHFARKARHTNKTVATVSAGKIRDSTFRQADGSLKDFTGNGQAIGKSKIGDSVIRINRQIGAVAEGDHPAVFSVEFPSYCIPIWTRDGEIVYEPYCGSGTTLIAAQRTGRRCYGMEIEPKYCDVILRRFEAETGMLAQRVDDGQ